MFFCTQCGANNSSDARFCALCGTPLTGVVSQEPPPPKRPVVYVPNYMVWSILSTVMCCLPFGIVAIVYSAQVDSKLRMKDYEGAKHSSSRARMWAWISFGAALVVWLIYVFAIAAAISQGVWK